MITECAHCNLNTAGQHEMGCPRYQPVTTCYGFPLTPNQQIIAELRAKLVTERTAHKETQRKLAEWQDALTATRNGARIIQEHAQLADIRQANLHARDLFDQSQAALEKAECERDEALRLHSERLADIQRELTRLQTAERQLAEARAALAAALHQRPMNAADVLTAERRKVERDAAETEIRALGRQPWRCRCGHPQSEHGPHGCEANLMCECPFPNVQPSEPEGGQG